MIPGRLVYRSRSVYKRFWGERNEKRSERILRSERGFTLVELGVVLAIMAILAVAAYPTYKNIRDRAYEAEAWAIMQEIRVEVWSHYLEHEVWPSDDFIGDGYDTEHWEFSGKSRSVETGEVGTKAYDIVADGDSKLTLTLYEDGRAKK